MLFLAVSILLISTLAKQEKITGSTQLLKRRANCSFTITNYREIRTIRCSYFDLKKNSTCKVCDMYKKLIFAFIFYTSKHSLGSFDSVAGHFSNLFFFFFTRKELSEP